MIELRQSTAVVIPVGPVVAIADGFTMVPAATVTAIDCGIKKHGTAGAAITLSASAGDNDMTATANNPGWYDLELTAGNTDTLGEMLISFNDVDVCLPFWAVVTVITQAEWDRKYSTGATVAQIYAAVVTNAAGTDIAADIIAIKAETATIVTDTNELQVDLVNGGRLDLIFDAIQTDTEDLQTQIGTDGAGLTALPWNAAWDEQVQSEVTDSLVAHNLDHLALTATVAADMTAEVANNTILSRIISNGVTLNFNPSTDGLQPIKDSLATSADIAGAVLDEQMAGHVDAGSAGKAIGDILVDTGTTIPGTITVIDNEIATIDTNVDSILADTQTDGVVVAAASKTGYTLAATTGLGNQTANITGNLSGSVGSVTGAVGSVTGAVGSVTSAVTLTAAGIDAVWDEPMQTGLSGRNALRALMAFVAGKTSGAATTSITFRDVGDTINMIVQTVDSEGDRSATTLTFA